MWRFINIPSNTCLVKNVSRQNVPSAVSNISDHKNGTLDTETGLKKKMDKLRKALSGDDSQPDEESGIMPQLMDSTTLSWSTRIKGFVVCFIIGILCSLLGSVCVFFANGMVLFAIFYTLGNIISLGSTFFLMGPVNQIKKMFAPTRVIATIIVLVMLGLTLFSALWWKKAGLTLLFVILQSLAMTWYSLSYIPYARDAVKKTVSACVA